MGVNRDGKREILGVSVSLSEHEVHWRAFLESLKARGLGGVQLITSDDHEGLKAARLAVFGGIPWQRCQFHLQQNAQAYVPRKDMQAEVAEDIRTIFNAPDRTTAEAYLAKTVEKYQKTASRLAEWMAANIPEGLTIFSFPTAHRHPDPHHQCRGTTASRSPSPGTCGEHLPESGFLPAPGLGGTQ